MFAGIASWWAFEADDVDDVPLPLIQLALWERWPAAGGAIAIFVQLLSKEEGAGRVFWLRLLVMDVDVAQPNGGR